MSVNNPQFFSRRDFLKVAGVGLGALAFKPFNLENLTKEALNPHSLDVLLPSNNMVGLLVTSDGILKKTVMPPVTVQNLLDDKLKVSVPWGGMNPNKPDGTCTLTIPNTNRTTTKKLLFLQEVKITSLVGSGDLDLRDEQCPIEVAHLVPYFDLTTNSVFVTDERGSLLRVSPPPDHIQEKAENNTYSARISYPQFGGRGRKPGVPIGYCQIRTTLDSVESLHKVTTTNFVNI